ncbi:FliI/YscN family ATPase [Seohaeicola saemankumensis]|nr:FliI/YscN family ATPase [Seohaeicola saemankumensis]MCA0870508.1 FliI/YscN family ATPase [Seohaeicola saemankumensis]
MDLQLLRRELDALELSCPVGRVSGVKGSIVEVAGLADLAQIGDHLVLSRARGSELAGEVLRIGATTIDMLPDTAADGVALNDPVTLHKVPSLTPGDHWIGRIIDPYGKPLDGKPLPSGREARPVITSPPLAASRRPMGERMSTGLAVLNTMLPVVRGQRVGLFAGSGVGKSRLLAQLARGMDADIVVIALIGERGREVNEFVHKVLGPEGMRRSVVVAATSDQSALTRRRCAWSAMAVAESFRDRGMNVLFLADSVTRFAEAHREVATSAGEAPALRGFPPSVTPMITALCERAGPGTEGQGDITAVFSVLVAGSDMDEPIADILRGVLDGHIILDREIAERGRFPAIDAGRSVSRSLPDAASDSENQIISEVRKYLGSYEQSEVMIRAGLYTEGADPVLDKAVRLWPELDAFFARSENDGIGASFDRLGLILRRGAGPADHATR